MFCDDIQDMDLTRALQSLMTLFVEHILTLFADITSIIKCKVSEWIASQAVFIQVLFRDKRYQLGKLSYLSMFCAMSYIIMLYYIPVDAL